MKPYILGRPKAPPPRTLEMAKPDCVACSALASRITGEQSVLALLAVLQGGHAHDALYRALCQRHHRHVDETVTAPGLRAVETH